MSIVPDSPETAHKATLLHDTGIGMALSDFTDNAAGLRALEITRPDVVTLDARHLGHATRSGDIAAHLRAACVPGPRAWRTGLCQGGGDAHQLEAVRDWGCDSVQGYLARRSRFPRTGWRRPTRPS